MTKGLLKVIKKAVQYATIVRIIRRAVPMFHRIAGRGVRPVWNNVNQMSKRNIWSKRDIPIRTSRAWEDGGYCARRQAPWVARELENWRKLMEGFMQPRTFDAYYVRPRNQRYAEETVRSEVERVGTLLNTIVTILSHHLCMFQNIIHKILFKHCVTNHD